MKMKLLIAMVLLSTNVFSQGTVEDTTKKVHNNIISLDATGLLRQFFNLNTGSGYLNSDYIIAYRRVIKNNALKLELGGDISNTNGKSNDTLNNTHTNYILNVSLGFEHYTYLSKKWTFYYGVNAIYNYSEYKNKTDWTTTSYYTNAGSSKSIGIAPVLGIVFKITNRVNIATETSYNVSYVKTAMSNSAIPYTQNDRKSTTAGIETRFIAPTQISFRFKF
jgi:hypothetical protein